uniref:RNase H type-1 domain-containing protein n=1 Tax=Cannabis sativa TaxID=3483 RepID=A0A803QEM1_CANSA
MVDWSAALVKDGTFVEGEDRELIYKIPISSTNTVDNWYWSKEASGVYTVKSAYNLIQDLKILPDPIISSGVWKSLWALKCPPKLHVGVLLGTYGDNPGEMLFGNWLQNQFNRWDREEKQLGAMLGEGDEQWCAHEENNYKINVDAATFVEKNRFGYGWVLRDARGQVLHARTRSWSGYQELSSRSSWSEGSPQLDKGIQDYKSHH